MATIEEIKEKIKEKQIRKEKALKEIGELDNDSKLPLWQLIQLKKGDFLKYPDIAQRVEETQRQTFSNVIKNKHPQLKEQEKDLFAQFYSEFLDGECKSINDFLYKNRLGLLDNDNLKDEFKC